MLRSFMVLLALLSLVSPSYAQFQLLDDAGTAEWKIENDSTNSRLSIERLGTGEGIRLFDDNKLGADQFCDKVGNNCSSAAAIATAVAGGSGGSGGGKFVDGTNAADAVFTGGNVGIGITAPTGRLTVAGQRVVTSRTASTVTNTGIVGGSTLGPSVSHPQCACDLSAHTLDCSASSFDAEPVGYTCQDRSGGSWITIFEVSQEEGLFVDDNVGIGTISPSEKLEVNGNVLADAFNSTSDIRLKTNIQKIQNAEGLLNLNGVTFNWKDTNEFGIGVIAQEVEAEYPLMVSTLEDGTKTVDYSKLVAPMIEFLKSQDAKIKELEQRLEAVE